MIVECAGESFKPRAAVRQQLMWKIQSRYVQDRTVTSLNRLDVLHALDGDAIAVPPGTLDPLRTPDIPGVDIIEPEHRPRTRESASGLAAAGRGVLMSHRSKLASRDSKSGHGSKRPVTGDVVTKVAAENDAFLDALSKRGFRYRSPFTVEEEFG